MKKNYILSLLIFLISGIAASAQTTLTMWNFESSTTAPSTGTGTLSLIGGTAPSATAFPSGNPTISYSITTFPGNTSASGTAGYQFAVSTVGYSGITVSFDTSGTNSSSKWQRYEYTVDGTNWISIENNFGVLTSTFSTRSYTLPATCNNNPNLAFRIVSIFAQPTNTTYAPVQGNYNGSNGKWQIDNVRFAYSALGVNQNNIAGLKIYPNPAKNTLIVSSDSFAEKQVVLYDVLGKVVLNTKVINNALNISAISKGIYVAKITEEGKTATRKVVIE